MQARGGNADLRAQAQFAAIGKTRGGVDHHHRRAQRFDEAARGSLVGGGNDLGVVGGVATDMGDGLLQAFDHAHGDDQVQELGGIVVLAGRLRIGHQGTGRRVATDLHAANTQRLRGPRQEIRRHLRMHQQGLQRIAHARARGLAVQQQAQGQVQVGGAVHVQVAYALVVLDHRHPRVFGHEADQAFAATRDRQVDDVGQLQQLKHGLAPQVGDQGQHGRVQPGVADGALQGGGNGGIGMDRLRSAAQDHAVAGLDAQRRRVGCHVRPRLVDHRDHAQRHAYPLDPDAVGADLAAGHLADRVGQGGHFAQGIGDGRQARAVQGQAVEHRPGGAVCAGRFQITRIGGQDRLGILVQCIGHGPQQRVLGRGVQLRQCLRGGAALQGLLPDIAHRRLVSPGAAPGRRGGSRCRRSCSPGSLRCRANGGARCGARPVPNTG